MRRGELLVRLISSTVDAERWPFLHRAGSWITSEVFSLAKKGVYRNFGLSSLEIKLATEFRYINEDYELPGIEFISQILRKGDTAVDVGANIGIYTLIMGKIVGKTGKIHSFEPADKSFRALLEHRAMNGLEDVIEGHQLLVGDQPRKQIFVEDGIKGTNRVGGSRSDGPEARAVVRETVTLDAYLPWRGALPRLIKIDVEGYELEVLRGAEYTIKASGCFVLCELHPALWGELGHGWEEIRAFVEGIGYEIRDISGRVCEPPGALERPLALIRPAEL